MAGAEGNKTSDKLKIFMSYSRADYEIAHQIVHELEQRDFDVKIDTRDLPFGEEWQKELAAFIQESDTIIWLVSEKSVKSHWCNWELAQVIRMQKRFIPVVIREVPVDDIPKAIGDIHLLPVGRAYDPAQDLDALITALNTDRGWIRQHTRFTDRALEWIGKDRPADMLLRGSALNEAIAWRDSRPRSAPAPGKDVMDLILQSQRGSARRQKLMTVGAGVIAVALGALAVFSFFQMNAAIEARTETARRSAMLAAGSAEGLATEGLTDEALLVLLDAANAFPDELPDRLTIAFEDVITQASRFDDVYLEKGAVAYPVTDGFVVHNAATGDLSRVTDAGLERLTTIPGEVQLIANGADDDTLIVLGKDWSLGRVKLSDGTYQATGRMSGMAGFVAVEDDAKTDLYLNKPEATPDGLILVTAGKEIEAEEFLYWSATALADPASGKEIFLTDETLSEEYMLPDQYAHMPNGERFLGNWDSSMFFEISPDFEIGEEPAERYFPVSTLFEAYACVKYAEGDFPALYDVYKREADPYWQFRHECVTDGTSLVVSDYEGTSIGTVRRDYVVMSEDNFFELDSRENFDERGAQNRDWIGVSNKRYPVLASVRGRNLMLLRGEGWETDQEYLAFPYPIAGASFKGDDRISILTSVRPRVRTLSLVEPERFGRVDVPNADMEGYSERAIERDACFMAQQTDEDCTLLSPDGEFVVTYGYDKPVKLGFASYDEAGDLLPADGSVATIEVTRPPNVEVAAAQVRWASDGGLYFLNMFDTVIWKMHRRADGEWDREEIYRSLQPVLSFDFIDGNENRMVIVETMGGGDVGAILWSREANMKWADLGNNYKWLNVLPREEGGIAFGTGAGWNFVYEVPTRSDLLNAAKAQLSDHCRPDDETDYASSVCWPL